MRLDDFRREYADPRFRMELNNVKLHESTTHAHQRGIIEVCTRLLEMRLPFATEVRLQGGGRADVVSPLTNEIFEVMCSETDARCDAKTYGKDFHIRKVRTTVDEQGILTITWDNTWGNGKAFT